MQNCLLYLYGPPASGKSSLVRYVSLLWQETSRVEAVLYLHMPEERVESLTDLIRALIKTLSENQVQTSRIFNESFEGHKVFNARFPLEIVEGVAYARGRVEPMFVRVVLLPFSYLSSLCIWTHQIQIRLLLCMLLPRLIFAFSLKRSAEAEILPVE